MKRIFYPLILVAILLSCEVDENSAVAPVEDAFDTTMATIIKQGMLAGVGHSASGTASVYESNGIFTVVLDPYTSQNGPDLKVYLSKDAAATEYIRLGNLKSVTGKQSYQVPAGTDINIYNFVHVWCERYSVEFARAEVK